MNVIHHSKLYLHQIYNIVFRGNNQRPQIISQKLMNVMIAITEIQFIGKGKIMQQYLILGNLQDIMRTFHRGGKERTPISRDITASQLNRKVNQSSAVGRLGISTLWQWRLRSF
jgi:hypothetical protein